MMPAVSRVQAMSKRIPDEMLGRDRHSQRSRFYRRIYVPQRGMAALEP